MKRIKVIRVPLWQIKRWAQTDGVTAELDVRAVGKKELELLMHEFLHILFPDLSEKEVKKKSIIITHTLWAEGFRKVDNRNKHPMQDGSKG